MNSALSKFDNITAAGILARTALSLNDDSNPAAKTILPNESAIRNSVILEFKNSLGIKPADDSDSAIDIIVAALDAAADELIDSYGEADDSASLERLSEKGRLPTDLYQIVLEPNIFEIHESAFPNERKLIEETVRAPDREQNFGKSKIESVPSMISIFTKFFPNKYSRKSFTMLVVGTREKLNMRVHQAWRIYEEEIPLKANESLVDLLKRFSETYGNEISMEGKVGKFIYIDSLDAETIHTHMDLKPSPVGGVTKFLMSTFVLKDPVSGGKSAAIANGVDLIKYKNTLRKYA